MKAVKYQKKSLIKLEDLLKRRKTSLKKFLAERGISTYQVLEETCARLGVVTPGFDSFNACVPSYVSDPTSGVVVVPPLDVVAESTGEREQMGDIFAAIPPTTAYEELVEAELSEVDENEIVAPIEMLEMKFSSKKKSKKAVGG